MKRPVKLQDLNIIANKDISMVADMLLKVSNLNIYNDSRHREYVEVRAVFYYIMREDYGATYSTIQKFMEFKSKKIHHATILHSIKNFEYYVLFNPILQVWRDAILNEIVTIKYDENAKNMYEHITGDSYLESLRKNN